MDFNQSAKTSYDIDLDNTIQAIKQCQANHNLDSCLKCNQVLDCITRKEYVKSAYESMNQGKTGGFEF